MRLVLALGFALAAVQNTGAQTPSYLIEWNFARPLLEVQKSYTQTVKLDDVVLPGTISCAPKALVATETTCSIVVAGAIPTAATHTLSVLAVSTDGQTAETRFTGLKLSAALTVDGRPRVSVTVTVAIP